MSNVLMHGYLGKDLVISQFLLHLHIHSQKLICSNNTTPTRRLWYGVYYSRRCFLLSYHLKNIFMLLLDIFYVL